jgi:hypothetical protein
MPAVQGRFAMQSRFFLFKIFIHKFIYSEVNFFLTLLLEIGTEEDRTHHEGKLAIE